MTDYGLPLLRSATELLSAVQSFDLSKAELCQLLATKTFHDLHARAVSIAQVIENGHVRFTDAFGMPEDFFSVMSDIPLTDDLGLTRAIKQKQVVWIDRDQNITERFPDLQKYSYLESNVTLIWVPIVRQDICIGAIGIKTDAYLTPEQYWDSFLLLVAEIVSTKFLPREDYSDLAKQTSGQKSLFRELTEREFHIWKLISENLTNFQISRRLGFSESTIRQNIIQIYRKLDVKDRKEARGKFREENQQGKIGEQEGEDDN